MTCLSNVLGLHMTEDQLQFIHRFSLSLLKERTCYYNNMLLLTKSADMMSHGQHLLFPCMRDRGPSAGTQSLKMNLFKQNKSIPQLLSTLLTPSKAKSLQLLISSYRVN